MVEQNLIFLQNLASINPNKLAEKEKVSHAEFKDEEIDRIIQMAWEDRTPFEAIAFQFGLKEKAVIEFMRTHSQPSSFRMWRKRMAGRSTKHLNLRSLATNRFKCNRQRSTGNNIAKR